jgi:hypothetical protein
MTDDSIPQVKDVTRLRLEPGDALVIRLETRPDEHDVHMIKERVRATFGRDDLPVLVTGPDVTVGMVALP